MNFLFYACHEKKKIDDIDFKNVRTKEISRYFGKCRGISRIYPRMGVLCVKLRSRNSSEQEEHHECCFYFFGAFEIYFDNFSSFLLNFVYLETKKNL